MKRPLPSERRRIIQRHVLSHDQLRLMRHYVIDPERVMLANCVIGMTGSPFWGVFGDPTIVLRYAPLYTARVIEFPERRSEIVKLKAELEEVKRFRFCPGGLSSSIDCPVCAVGT
jgi:hypothetical protein